jgi:hypothetical protein
LHTFIRAPRDFWAGIIFMILGLAAVYIARDYTMNLSGRIGPGYFPTMLGGILAVIGIGCVGRSLVRRGEPVAGFAGKEVALICISTLLFGLLIGKLGMPAAIIVVVIIAGMASDKFRLLPYLTVASGLAIFSALLFIKGLGLPMPLLGTWFGY